MRRLLRAIILTVVGLFGGGGAIRIVERPSLFSRWWREKPKEIDDGMTREQIGFPFELAGRRHYDSRVDEDIRKTMNRFDND